MPHMELMIPDDDVEVLAQEMIKHFPADAALLITYPGFMYLDRVAYHVDPIRDQYVSFETWERFTSDVKRLRICYVLSPRPPIPESMTILEYQPARQAPRFLDRLVTSSARELARAGDSALYQLTTCDAPASPDAAAAASIPGR